MAQDEDSQDGNNMAEDDPKADFEIDLEEEMGLDEDMELIEIDDDDGVEIDDENDLDAENYVPEQDDSLFSYQAHEGDVFACCLSPNGRFAATGGEDERLIVWDTESRIVVFKYVSFKDSVMMVEFSHDGKFLAAGDMEGNITIFKVEGLQFEEIHSQQVDNTKWIQWHPSSHSLILGSPFFWKFIISDDAVVPEYVTTEQYSTDVGHFMPDGKRALLGFEDGSVKVINTETKSFQCKFTSSSTKLDSIISVAVHPDNDVVAVGTISSRVAIFKTQTPKLLGAIDCNETGPESEMLSTSVESLHFGSSLKYPIQLLVAGTDSCLHMIEYQRLNIRSTISVEDGLTRFIWPKGMDLVFVGTKKGPVNVYNPFTSERMMSFEGQTSNIFDINISMDKKRLIVGGNCDHVRIFGLEEIKPKAEEES